MKPLFKMNHLLVLLFSLGIFFTCKKDEAVPEDPPPSPTSQNLMANGSFENGGGSTQGWYRYPKYPSPSGWMQIDTNWNVAGAHYFHYKQDAPSGGGNLSLQVNGTVDFQQGTSIVAMITGQSGTGTYQLSGWAKRLYPGCLAGSIGFNKLGAPSSSWRLASLDTTLHVWKKYTITDTLTTLSTDTILVKLTATGGGPCGDQLLFDLIELKRLD